VGGPSIWLDGMTAMIIEHIATICGGHELLGSDEFRQIVRSLSSNKVRSLKEKSESYEILTDLMEDAGWKPQIRLGARVGRRVDFYKLRVKQVVEVIASTTVWIASTLARLANVNAAMKALYLVLSLDEVNCSFENVLKEIESVVNVLATSRRRPLIIIGCRSLPE